MGRDIPNTEQKGPRRGRKILTKILLFSLILLVLCGFLFRKQLFPPRAIVQLFPLGGTNYLQLETRGKRSYLSKFDWQTDKALWRAAVPEAPYDTNSYADGWWAPYAVTTEEVFVYRFLRNFPIPHRKSDPRSFQWAVNLDTGNLLWYNEYEVEGKNFNYDLGTLRTEEDVLLNFTNDEEEFSTLYLDAVDLKSGERLWTRQYALQGPMTGYPEIIGSHLLLQDQESLYLFDPGTGEEIRKIDQYGYGFSTRDGIYYIARDSKAVFFCFDDGTEEILGDQFYNPFWNSALFEGDILNLTNNGENESGTGSELTRTNPESGEVLWYTVLSDEFTANAMKDVAKALPRQDSWRYPHGPYAPLILKKEANEQEDYTQILVMDLLRGEILRKSPPRLLPDISLFMSEVVQGDDLVYLNLREERALLSFNPSTGRFLKAVTIVFKEEDGRDVIVFPGTALEQQWGISPIKNGKVYIGREDWKCIVDLESAELVYSNTPAIAVVDKTSEIFALYGLE